MKAFALPTRRRLMLGALAVATAAPALAQDYPTRPVRLFVGYSAGGGMDAVARLIAPALGAQLGQQVVVENRPGAAGLLAADAVARSPADGYALLLGESGLLIAQHLQPRAGFDPLKDFAPIGGLFNLPLMIVSRPDFAASSPRTLIDELKAHPGKYAYATSGVGTVHHLGMEMLKGRSGAFVLHIPYRGASQIVPDIIGGQVPLGVVSAAAGIAQIRGGKIKGLAMMSDDKLAGAEGVAPLSQGLPGFNVAPRLYLAAPAGTPPAIVVKLEEAVRIALAKSEVVHARPRRARCLHRCAPTRSRPIWRVNRPTGPISSRRRRSARNSGTHMTLVPTLGLIVPPAHGRVPDDGPRLYAGRAHFLARGLGIDSISSGGFAPVIEAIRDHAVALRNDGVRAISLMGTSLSFHRGLTFTEDLCAQMADVTGLPCTTMSHAIVRALRTLGVRRVAVATAYTDALNHDLKRFLTGLDFEVTALEGLDMTDVLAVGRVGPDVLTQLALRVHERAPHADGLLLSCGGLRTLDLLAPLQARCEQPVVASSPAGFWDLMACAGLDATAHGFGRLFERPAPMPAPLTAKGMAPDCAAST